MSELWFKPACELAEAIQAKELSPVELMEACLERIDQVNPLLNAFIAMRRDEAMAEARATADRIARGEAVGPLAGLPFGVKELEDAAGVPSPHAPVPVKDNWPGGGAGRGDAAGSPPTHASVPFKDNWPERDSVQVERLKKAGGIMLGKTNSPEFGYTASTKNLLFGVSRNPWNPERTPGGSSGGSSAAIASGMVPLATGSDGGGSVRIPASRPGWLGAQPSFRRPPLGPVPDARLGGRQCLRADHADGAGRRHVHGRRRRRPRERPELSAAPRLLLRRGAGAAAQGVAHRLESGPRLRPRGPRRPAWGRQ